MIYVLVYFYAEENHDLEASTNLDKITRRRNRLNKLLSTYGLLDYTKRYHAIARREVV